MIEIGIGFFFAILFVTAYLLVSRLLRKGDDGQPRWRELGNPSHGGSHRVAPKSPPLFLKTGEMGEHHSKKQ
ncbi:MAG TPA: hypothetical protein VGC66_02895 [Pyrinomonadaceae bacterium]|jgi:hypothetical protein